MEPPVKSNIASNIYKYMSGKKIKNFPATEDEFLSKLSSDATVRQNVYNYLSSQKVKNFPETIEAFEQALGLGGKKKVDSGQPLQTPSPLSTNGSTLPQEQVSEPVVAKSQTPQPKVEKETNPFVTAGRVITDFFTNTLPATAAGAAAALTPDNPNAVTPGGGAIMLTPEQREKDKEASQAFRTAMVEYAEEQFGESAEIREGLVNNMSDIEDPLDALNYFFGAVAEAGVQIPLAIGTGGASSIIQGIGGIYTQAVLEQAAKEGKTPEEIIAEGKDSPATAIAFGVLSGALDRLGAGGVASNLSKGGLLNSLRKRGLQAISRLPETVRRTGNVIGASAGESVTEGLQTVLESVGVSVSQDETILEALSKITDEEKLNEIYEAMAKGAIGGGFISTVGQVGQAIGGKSSEQSINTDQANEQMVEEAEAARQVDTQTQEEVVDEPTPTPEENVNQKTQTQEQNENITEEEQQQEPMLEELQTSRDENQEGQESTELRTEETQNEVTPNEEPTQTPDNTETQTEDNLGESSDPPVGESEPTGNQGEVVIQRGNNRYKVKKDGKTLNITKEDGSEPTPQTKRRVENDYAEQFNYTQGKLAITPDTQLDGIKHEEMDRYIADNSENPSEIAQQWSNSTEQSGIKDYKTEQIGQNIDKVDPDQFNRIVGDTYAKDDKSIGLNWLRKGGKKIDLLAQELTESSGVEITPQDIVDFILENPGGWKPNEKTSDQIALEQKFSELTGLPLNGKTAELAIQKESRAQADPLESLNEEERNQRLEQESQPENEYNRRVKVRQFIDNQLMEDLDISDEVKQGLREDTINYIPKSNKITAAEANAIIEVKGEDQALVDFLNDSSEMTPEVRVVLGEQLLLRLNGKLADSQSTSEKNTILDKTISIADKLAKDGTKYGRAIQAYAAYSKLSPEGILRVNQKRFQTKREKELAKVKEEMKQVKQVLKESVEPAATEAVKSKKVKSLLDKIKNKKTTTRKKAAQQGNDALKKARVKFDQDFLGKLDKLKIDTKGAAFDVTYRLTAEVYNGAIEVIKKSYQAGRTIQEAVEDAIKYIKENFTGDWDESGFRRQFNADANKQKAITKLEQGDVEGAIKAELSDLETSLDELVREHYSKINTTKRSLLDKFVNDLGLEAQDATDLATVVEQEFDRIVSEKQKTILNKLYNKNVTPKAKRKKKELIDKIVEQHNMGALKDETLRDLYADHMNLPKLTPEQAERLMKLSEKVQSAKEGFQKNRAIQDLYSYQEKIADKNKGWWNSTAETYEALWMASILSGPSTLLVVNPFANFAESVGELFVMSVKSPHDLGVILSGFVDGLGRGWKDAVDTFRTGYVPEKGGKIEVPMLLERTRFKGGKWNPFNYYKYVGRILTGGDILFYQANKEAKTRQLAMKRARQKNLVNPTKNIWDEAYRDIFGSEDAIKNATEQAKGEGLKGRDLKRRIFEIIEQGREEDLRQDATDFASRATFNYDPEGTLGVLANAANLARNIPGVRFLVPFVRIVSNVLDRYIDWTPFAVVRIAKGGKGFASYYKPFEGEQAIDTKIKAITGTLMMGALYALSESFGEDDEPFLEITADGTGDRSKNYELQEGGWQEYSVKIGGKYISYKNTPLGIALSVIGSIRDQEKYQGTVNWSDKFALSMYATSQFMMNQSFIKNLADFIQIFNSSGSYNSPETAIDKVSRIFSSPIEGIATPNAYRQTARLIMEINNMPIKRANGILERMVRDYPVLRDDLNNIYNSLGEPVVIEQSERLIPFGIVDEKEPSKAWRIIIENQAWVGTPRKVPVYDSKIGKDRDMTDKEYTEYLKLSGAYIKEDIEKNYDYLKSLPKSEVQREINQIKTDARVSARYELFAP